MGMGDITNSADGAAGQTDEGFGEATGNVPVDASVDVPADSGADDAANAPEDKIGDAIRGLGDKIKGAFHK